MKTKLCLAALLAALGGLLTLPDAPAVGQGPGAAIEVHKTHADFRVGSELVGRYHFGAEVAKPYFWPLNAPGGVTVTRAWPMEKGQPGESVDHPHQKSAWFCHGDVIPEGIELKHKIKGVEGVDFWSEAKGHGRIVCTKVEKPVVLKDRAQLLTKNEWRTADGLKILDEDRLLSLQKLGGAYLLVCSIQLQANVCPITFGDTKEGSFAVRVHDQLRERGGKGKLSNAEGKTGASSLWGQRSPWNDYSGSLDGKNVGIAIFDYPNNHHPAYWHSRDYGLMAANPFGRAKSGFPALKGKTDLVKMDKGQRLTLLYGILLHSGDVKEGKVAEHYKAFLQRATLDW